MERENSEHLPWNGYNDTQDTTPIYHLLKQLPMIAECSIIYKQIREALQSKRKNRKKDVIILDKEGKEAKT